MKKYAVIMAGGAGERFWPVSRIEKPKHLWNVTGEKKCLLSQTFARVAKIVPKENIFVITNSEQVKAISKTCPEIKPEQIVAEPLGRDTTAAIGVSAMLVERLAKGEPSAFAVFPSDHVINDTANFRRTILQAFQTAKDTNGLVTVGIKPTFPATGYGYIQRGKAFETKSGRSFKIEHFFEKPNLASAKKYIASGKFYWNAGMFIWNTSAILEALKDNVPQTFKQLRAIGNLLDKGADFNSTLKKIYPKIEKISIDFSVMEKAKNAYVVPSGFDWDDVGSWTAVERHIKKDKNSNTAVGELFSLDSTDCVVFDCADRATALIGVKDLIVVHSADATLVCRREYAQRLKELVRTLPKKYR